MKKALSFIVWFMLMAFQSFAQSPNWQWVRGSTGPVVCEGWSAAADADGSVYEIGYFYNGSVTVGPSTFSDTGSTSDVLYIVKYYATGNLAWIKLVDTGAAFQYAITVDGNSDIYVTGMFKSKTAGFGPYTLVNADTGGQSYDIFITKYDTAGNILSAKRVGGPSNDEGHGITVDGNNNVYVTGSLTYKVIFGADTLMGGIYGSGFVAKYNAAGSLAWAQTLGENSEAEGYSTATDNNGNAYVTGVYYADSITFGNTTFYNHGYNYTADIFIVKYDSAGNLLWAKATGGDAEDDANWVTTGKDGSVYITGLFRSDSITFGTTTLYNACPIATCGGSADIFIVKYSSTGDMLWAKKFGGIADDEGYSAAIDANDNLFVTGKMNSDSLAFDSTILYQPLIGADPAFMAIFDSSGNVQCAEVFSSGGDDQNVVCFDRDGNGFWVGDFVLSPFIVGPDTLFGPPDTSTFFDYENLFIAKFRYGKGNELNIENLTDAPTLTLYPNPFTGQATVQYTLPARTQSATLIIYDLLGRQQSAYQLNNTGGYVTVNANNLSNGVYLYSLLVDGRVMVTNKMVVE